MSRRVKLNDDDLATEAGLGLLALLEQITADGTVTKDEVRELGAWLESVAATATVPGLHCLREEVAGILADNRITEPELRVLRDAVLRVLPAKARKKADARFYAARQRATIERELAHGYDRAQPQPATEAQLAYIRDLGGAIPEGLDTGSASTLITTLLETRPTARRVPSEAPLPADQGQQARRR